MLDLLLELNSYVDRKRLLLLVEGSRTKIALKKKKGKTINTRFENERDRLGMFDLEKSSHA